MGTAVASLSTCFESDFDCDCDVDIIDVTTAAYCYGTETGDANYNALYDLDDDGDIDIIDITIVAYNYGWTCGKSSSEIINFDHVNNEDVVLGLSSINDNYDGTYNIELYVEDIEQLGGYELELDFDPNAMEVLSLEQGNLIGSTGRTMQPLLNVINNKAGKINYAVTTLGSQINGASGEGVLLNIHCKPLESTFEMPKLEKAQLARIDAHIIKWQQKFVAIMDNESAKSSIIKTYPSPFKNDFTLEYKLAKQGKVHFDIFDAFGQKCLTTPIVIKESGTHKLKFNKIGLLFGVYFITMYNQGQRIDSKRIIIIK